jgi:DNA polymerase elongation subunit (family B)
LTCVKYVVYGDTDSCFSVVPPSIDGPESHVKNILEDFHKEVRSGPFLEITVDMEPPIKRLLMISEKRYYYVTQSDVLRSKGLSMSRKDRIGVCRKIVPEIVSRSPTS